CVKLLCAHLRDSQPCAACLTAARFLMLHGYVEKAACAVNNPAQFIVPSPDTPRFYYSVDLRCEACTCADFLRYQRPCKHIYAVALTLLAHRCFGCSLPAAQPKARGR